MLALICASLTLSKCAFYCGRRLERYRRRRASCPGRLRIDWVDLQKLDFVVMSHRHGDHMGGMAYLIGKNPRVKIFGDRYAHAGVGTVVQLNADANARVR